MSSSPPPRKKQKTGTCQSLPELIGSLCRDISTVHGSVDGSQSENGDCCNPTTCVSRTSQKQSCSSSSSLPTSPAQSLKVSPPNTTRKQFFHKCHILFRDIVNLILRNYLLMVGNPSQPKSQVPPHSMGPSIQFYQILEVEMYCSHPRFQDPYTHSATIQKQNAKWYFHRKGEHSYSGGSFKGLDISVGGAHTLPSGEECEMHGGILLRTLRNIETEETITGPSLCVDKLLSVCGHESIRSLVESWNDHLDVFDLNKNVCLVEAAEVRHAADKVLTILSTMDKKQQDQQQLGGHHHHHPTEAGTLTSTTTTATFSTSASPQDILVKKLRHRPQLELLSDILTKDLQHGAFKNLTIVPSFRVGIYLNTKPDAHLYCAQLLRWVSRAPEVKKGKTEMILGLLHEGHSTEEVASMAGVTLKAVKTKEVSWKKGKEKEYETFLNAKRPKVGEYCEMMGSLDEYVV